MNAVLVQELARFNHLIEAIHSSLAILDKTLDGALVSTDNSEAMLRSVLQNELPTAWKTVSYPSKKSLLSYVEDLGHRITMLE
jgi:dynein heavy chain, axonemal